VKDGVLGGLSIRNEVSHNSRIYAVGFPDAKGFVKEERKSPRNAVLLADDEAA
jgi:hypothetical protein